MTDETENEFKVNGKILYNDVVEKVLEFLKTVCNNIGGFSGSVPAELKNGYSYNLASQTFTQTYMGARGTNSVRRKGYTGRLVATVKDNMTRDYVTEQNIKDDFNDFLSARGINITDKVKDNTEGNKSEIISMKGIMNFYANVSSFIASRLIYVVDSYGHGPVLFYNHNSGISYSNVTFDSIIDKNHPDFTSSEIETCTNNLLDSLTNTTKVYNVNVVLNYYSSCCSSSSSSSSSSSCSSSSSSSSWFIAYMDI